MISWAYSEGLTHYPVAARTMETVAADIASGSRTEMVWLLEHPPLYTRGASAVETDLRDPHRFPVHDAPRGGQFTYHGPGQRVAYVMMDLSTRGRDVRGFVCDLEGWLIETLAAFNIRAERRPGRVGVWVDRSRAKGPGREDKIAAIGLRVRKWVTFHGISLNVSPDLDHFSGITPCGQSNPAFGVTSLEDLGVTASMAEVDIALRTAFERRFGPTRQAAPPTPGGPASGEFDQDLIRGDAGAG